MCVHIFEFQKTYIMRLLICNSGLLVQVLTSLCVIFNNFTKPVDQVAYSVCKNKYLSLRFVVSIVWRTKEASERPCMRKTTDFR